MGYPFEDLHGARGLDGAFLLAKIRIGQEMVDVEECAALRLKDRVYDVEEYARPAAAAIVLIAKIHESLIKIVSKGLPFIFVFVFPAHHIEREWLRGVEIDDIFLPFFRDVLKDAF